MSACTCTSLIQQGFSNLIMKPASLGHCWEAGLFPTNVSEYLKHHETQKQEVETKADSCNYNKCHLSSEVKGNSYLTKQEREENIIQVISLLL